MLFVGNSQGVIRKYSIDKEYDYNAFNLKEVDSLLSNKDVLSMDVSNDGNYLISGYKNGYLCLWDISTAKCKKIVTNLFKSGLIAIKFIKNDKMKFEMVVSELSGILHYVTLRDGTFTFHQDARNLMTSESPFYSIEVLKFAEEDLDRAHFQEFYNSIIIGVACLDFVCVLMLEPAEVMMFTLDKPKYIKDYYIPDISFGVGYIPFLGDDNNISTIEKNMTESNLIDNVQTSQGTFLNEFIDYLKPQCLFCISWGENIYIYSLNAYSNNYTGTMKINFTQAGHYINGTIIYRMSIIANSIIFIFDKDNKLKVLNTSLVTPGELYFEDKDPWNPVADKRFTPELEEGNIIDQELDSRSLFKDPNGKSTQNYIPYILNINKSIFLCSKTSFYHGKLLNWEQSLNTLTQKADWMDALSLGLDIYHGRTLGLSDIPQEEGMRRAILGKYLMRIITNYVVLNLGGDDNIIIISDRSLKDKIAKCINITIEFCIDMGTLDFLMGVIMLLFEKKGYGNLFMEKLQPFILCDAIKSKKMPFDTIKKIIATYVSKKRTIELAQILVHLGINSLDNEEIRKECNKFNLTTPIIFIYTNSTTNQDYFFPITKMYDIYTHSEGIKNFTDYKLHYKNLTNEIEMSKQFSGHKMLWYIHICLKGEKLPSGVIPENAYRKLVLQILLWLVKNEVFIDLLKFAPLILFNKIMIMFIDNERIRDILSQVQLGFGTSNTLPDLKPSTILEYIIQKSKESGCATTMFHMYILLAKCAWIMEISKNQFIEAGKFILQAQKNNEVIFDTHLSSSQTQANTKEISNILISMINIRTDFDSTDLNALLFQVELSPFIFVKIHLLKCTKNYSRCLHEFFQNNAYLKNKENENSIFEWINETLQELSVSDLYHFDLLKEEVLNRLSSLTEVSIEQVIYLVESWYKNDQTKVLSKLNNVKQLQLKYVENVLEKNRDNIEYFMTHDSYDIQSDGKFGQYSEILKLHIKLLCKIYPEKVTLLLNSRYYTILKNALTIRLMTVSKCVKSIKPMKVPSIFCNKQERLKTL